MTTVNPSLWPSGQPCQDLKMSQLVANLILSLFCDNAVLQKTMDHILLVVSGCMTKHFISCIARLWTQYQPGCTIGGASGCENPWARRICLLSSSMVCGDTIINPSFTIIWLSLWPVESSANNTFTIIQKCLFSLYTIVQLWDKLPIFLSCQVWQCSYIIQLFCGH